MSLGHAPSDRTMLIDAPCVVPPGVSASGRRMRALCASIAVVFCLANHAAQADDPRSTYLIKLLTSSSQFRVRAQAAISLGSVEGSSGAIAALTTALHDVHPAVRAAAATSLGRIGDPSSVSALRSLDRDPEEPVRSAARASIDRLASARPITPTEAPSSSEGPALYYVSVAAPGTRVTTIDKASLGHARDFIKQRVQQIQGVLVAPDSEDSQAAERVLKKKRLKGFYIDSSIVSVEKKSGGATRVAVSVIVATYPGRDMRAIMQGAATVSGGGDQAYGQALEGAFSGA
ncbi:MAG TPA: HEAT repeat domain-containing protein, partial [Polyangiales bacterium]